MSLNWIGPVKFASTCNLSLFYGVRVIDGCHLTWLKLNDKILVKDQLNQKENGIYLCKGCWYDGDFQNYILEKDDKIEIGSTVFVEYGNINGGESYSKIGDNWLKISATPSCLVPLPGSLSKKNEKGFRSIFEE